MDITKTNEKSFFNFFGVEIEEMKPNEEKPTEYFDSLKCESRIGRNFRYVVINSSNSYYTNTVNKDDDEEDDLNLQLNTLLNESFYSYGDSDSGSSSYSSRDSYSYGDSDCGSSSDSYSYGDSYSGSDCGSSSD
jgi:hypothetical protein